MARIKKPKNYQPNVVSATTRMANTFLGFVLTLYGLSGLITSHLNLNGSRVRIAELEGGPAWLMAAAFLVGASVLFSVVIDHYDKRNNERYYQAFRWGATRLGWCLVAGALAAHLYVGLFS